MRPLRIWNSLGSSYRKRARNCVTASKFSCSPGGGLDRSGATLAHDRLGRPVELGERNPGDQIDVARAQQLQGGTSQSLAIRHDSRQLVRPCPLRRLTVEAALILPGMEKQTTTSGSTPRSRYTSDRVTSDLSGDAGLGEGSDFQNVEVLLVAPGAAPRSAVRQTSRLDQFCGQWPPRRQSRCKPASRRSNHRNAGSANCCSYRTACIEDPPWTGCVNRSERSIHFRFALLHTVRWDWIRT